MHRLWSLLLVSSRVGQNMENIWDLGYEGWTSKTSSKEKGKGPGKGKERSEAVSEEDRS